MAFPIFYITLSDDIQDIAREQMNILNQEMPHQMSVPL
jgi:hypothetical protein